MHSNTAVNTFALVNLNGRQTHTHTHTAHTERSTRVQQCSSDGRKGKTQNLCAARTVYFWSSRCCSRLFKIGGGRKRKVVQVARLRDGVVGSFRVEVERRRRRRRWCGCRHSEIHVGDAFRLRQQCCRLVRGSDRRRRSLQGLWHGGGAAAAVELGRCT